MKRYLSKTLIILGHVKKEKTDALLGKARKRKSRGDHLGQSLLRKKRMQILFRIV